MCRLPVTVLLVAVALALGPAATAQEKKVPWANKIFTGTAEAPPPVILHDFGVVPKGTVKTYRFQMTNVYAFPLHVREPKASCGCVSVVEYTGKMNPKQTGHILIKMDTARVDGLKSVRLPVRIDARDPKTGEDFYSEAELEIRAVSRSDIAINPGHVVFGTVPAGQAAKQTLSIVYSGRQRDWQITEVMFRKEVMDVDVTPVAVRGGVSYRVTATLKDSAPAGEVVEQIIMKTNDREAPALTLAVTGLVQAPLSVVGAEAGNVVKMGGVEVGKKVEKRLIVRANKAFKVTDVAGQGDGISSTHASAAANSLQVVIVVFTPEKPGPVKKELTVKTDSGEEIALMVEGIGTEPK